MNRIKKITLILTVVCLLCGCTKSYIIKREGNDDNLPQLSPEGILWEQVWEEFDSMYSDDALYPFINSANGAIDTETKEMQICLLLNEEISSQEAADYATEVLKGFNDLISSQNSEYAFSSDSSYGGYVSQCSVHVIVSMEEYMLDKSRWIIEDRIPAGEYRPVNPDAVPEEAKEAASAKETAEE